MESQAVAGAQVALRPYTLQLRSVRVARIKVEPTAVKGKAKAEARAQKGLPIGLGLHVGKAEAEGEFMLLMDFDTRIPVGDKLQYSVEMTVQGVFLSVETEPALRDEDLMRFKGRDATVVLWPYLRAYLSNTLSQMGFAGIPPLPLIDPRSIVKETQPQGRPGGRRRPAKDA
jgi:preprotein translocase subunit SecB